MVDAPLVRVVIPFRTMAAGRSRWCDRRRGSRATDTSRAAPRSSWRSPGSRRRSCPAAGWWASRCATRGRSCSTARRGWARMSSRAPSWASRSCTRGRTGWPASPTRSTGARCGCRTVRRSCTATSTGCRSTACSRPAVTGRWSRSRHDGSTARVRAVLDFAAHPELMAAFPFPHEVLLEAALTAEALTITTRIRATGDVPVPISFGFHPYLRLPGADRDGLAGRAPGAAASAARRARHPDRRERGEARHRVRARRPPLRRRLRPAARRRRVLGVRRRRGRSRSRSSAATPSGRSSPPPGRRSSASSR